MKIILQCLALVISMTAFLPFIRSNVWWIRGFEFPRMQLLAVAIILGATLAFYGFEGGLIDGAVFGFLVLSIGTQVWWMQPYSRLARRQVLAGGGGRGLSIFVANVLMSNRQIDRLLALIHEKMPDVFIAVETDQWWVERLRALAADYPHAVEVPRDNTYGMVLRSRLPLIGPSVEYLVNNDIPSIHTDVRIAGGELIRLHAVHPKPPFPAEDTSTTDRDAELLIVGKRVAKHSGPAIVAGDLNDVAWSKTTRLFQKISRLLDPRIGRGRFSTYHAKHWWLRWPLDHVFLSDHFRLRWLEVQPSIGSDHFPILVDLSFEPERQTEQNAPKKNGSDEKEARQAISDARSDRLTA